MAMDPIYPYRSAYILSLLFVVVNLALSSQIIISAAPYDSAIEGSSSKNVTTLLTNDIAQNLQRVLQILQRASDEVDISNGDAYCRRPILNALKSAQWLQTHQASYGCRLAIQKLDELKATLSACSENHLPESYGISELLLDLTNQASKFVDRVHVLLLDFQARKSKGTNVGEKLCAADTIEGASNASTVDGTKCQFSRYGRGQMLPNCAIGFAEGVTGGQGGRNYTVTSAEDNPQNPEEGTLRYAVRVAANSKGVWITFAKNMVINLKTILFLRSNTTIDGRGANVTITGNCLVLAGVHNVILHNFQINSIPRSDTVHIFAGSSMVWVDHLTSFNAKLGLVSVVQGATDVTISNSFLSNRNFNMLLGASDTDSVDQNLRVTVYRNWFKDSMQRMPHCRWGYCHVLNNLYTNWGYYAIGGRANAKVYSEKNAFFPVRKREVTPWFRGRGLDMSPEIISSNDLLLDGATFHQFLRYATMSSPQYKRLSNYPPAISPHAVPKLVHNCAGALFGSKLEACMQST